MENMNQNHVVTLSKEEQTSIYGGKDGDLLKFISMAYGYFVGSIVEAVQEYKEGFVEGYENVTNS